MLRVLAALLAIRSTRVSGKIKDSKPRSGRACQKLVVHLLSPESPSRLPKAMEGFRHCMAALPVTRTIANVAFLSLEAGPAGFPSKAKTN